MNLLFDEAGKFLAGKVLSEAEASFQVELDSGKRVKVKASNALLQFAQPAPAALLAQAQEVADGVEPDLAWEFAADGDFGFADLAQEYFATGGTAASVTQQVGMLLALHGAPHYFRRAGKGRYRKADAQTVQLALAAIEKKKQVLATIADWAQQLAAGQCPAPVREQLYKILFKPDKNAPEYRAVVEAAKTSQLAPLALLQRAGAITSAYEFHWQRFLFDNFPKGTTFPAVQAPPIADDLPRAPVAAFSIDDSSTTEIDDALSLQGLGTGTVTLGIHIAAPALAVQPNDAIDKLGRARLSTVYMPGHKITMLPDAVVQNYTLQAGRDCPALSVYVQLDEATLAIQGSRTALEAVPIVANLRHDQLDELVTEAWLARSDYFDENGFFPILDAHKQLFFLYHLATHLKAAREQVRGKPETFNRPDYSFKLLPRVDGAAEPEPDGTETVQISVRKRGAPLDLIVAEAMILANSTWGQLLADHGVPGIYRSQASLAPGVKVRMGTRAQAHAGIGVKCYAWSTSPLRRYVDLVNQWQIISCVRHGKTAALAAPFKPKDAELFAIISSFEAAYSAYNAHQNAMERLWTLKHLQQNGITELDGVLFKDNLVRADSLPLVLSVLGAQGLPRGAHLRVRLGAVDEIALDVSGTLLARLDDTSGGADEPDEDDAEAMAGPIAIAINLDENPETSADNPNP